VKLPNRASRITFQPDDDVHGTPVGTCRVYDDDGLLYVDTMTTREQAEQIAADNGLELEEGDE